MLTAGEFKPEWLALREPADAVARDESLLGPLLEYLPARRRESALPGRESAHRGPELVIRDLGCGTGANRRWLAPRLPGPQHWILHDRDPALLARAAREGDETRLGDIATLQPADLAGTSLVTASALLDVLAEPEAVRLAQTIAGAAVPALITLTVAGRVELEPSEPLDTEVAAAFDRHQHRGGRLGPDAVTVVADALQAAGCTVHRGRSPWRLGAAHRELTAEWLRGWCAAAAEERPDLGRPLDAYLTRRLAACEAGALRVVVHHVDLLVLPGGVR